MVPEAPLETLEGARELLRPAKINMALPSGSFRLRRTAITHVNLYNNRESTHAFVILTIFSHFA